MEIKDKILPKDVFSSVSVVELNLEENLKISYVNGSTDDDLLPMQEGTFICIEKNGESFFRIKNHEVRVRESEVLMASASDIDEFFTREYVDAIMIFIGNNLFVNSQELFLQRIDQKKMHEVLQYINLLETQISSIGEFRIKIIKSLTSAFVYALQENADTKCSEKKQIPTFIRNFASMIGRYHHIPVYRYAEMMSMNSIEFNRECKEFTGISAAEWISQFVMLEAQDMLLRTHIRPTQIASMLSFNNYDTFARWFRRNSGELPTSWR